MKKPALISPLFAVIAAFFLSIALPAYSQNAAADLDRDGIANISDRDVDNDGVLNGADRNIDGGTARSGPFRGRYIGDNFPNDSLQELDMDADGLADNAVLETDIDGDGLLDGECREIDIDGDGLADNALSEADIDGDGLLDNAANETDIDGDGVADGVNGEVDIDGDGSVNGSDADVDGDGLANAADADMDGTGVVDDIFSGNEHNYLPDSEVAPIIASVSAEVRKTLNIAANDAGLRVRVLRESFLGPYTGLIVSGVWRYLSPDHMQVWATRLRSPRNCRFSRVTAIPAMPSSPNFRADPSLRSTGSQGNASSSLTLPRMNRRPAFQPRSPRSGWLLERDRISKTKTWCFLSTCIPHLVGSSRLLSSSANFSGSRETGTANTNSNNSAEIL